MTEAEYDKWAWDGNLKIIQVPLPVRFESQTITINSSRAKIDKTDISYISLKTKLSSSTYSSYAHLKLDDAENLATLMLYLVDERRKLDKEAENETK